MGDTVSVASTVYNLAGDESERINYLKSLLLGGIIQEADSLGKVTVEGYRNGPALRFRRFKKWSETNPDFVAAVGAVQGNLNGVQNLDYNVIKDNIPVVAPESVNHVETARIETANMAYWVLRFLLEKYPADESRLTGYTFKFDKVLNKVVITYADGSTEEIATPADYVSGAEFLYAKWLPGLPGYETQPEMGSYTTLPGAPNLAGWTLHSEVEIGTYTATLGTRETRTVTYSDGRPSEGPYVTTVNKQSSIKQYRYTYFRDAFKGKGPGDANSVYSERHWMDVELTYVVGPWTQYDNVIRGVSEIEPGVWQTVTTVKERQNFEPVYKTREGFSQVIHKAWDNPRYFIYRKNSGIPALDALFNQVSLAPMDEFFPPIPFRYENQPVGPVGLGNRVWKVNLGIPYLDETYMDLQIAGGDVPESDPIICVNHGAELDWGVFRIASRYSTDTRPIGSVLKSKSARFRVITYAGPNPYNDTNQPIISDWAPFPVAPEPSSPMFYPDQDAEKKEQEAAIQRAKMEAIYPACKKAFRKAFGTSFDDVQDKILNNKSIEQIDHVYAVFGVSLNVKEQACRKYVYKFFQHLMNSGPNPTPDFENQWYQDWNNALAAEKAWKKWHQETRNEDYGVSVPEPPKPVFPEIPWQTLKVEMVKDGISDYRTEIKWAFISETSGTARLTKPDGELAKKDELWFEVLDPPLAEYREVDEENPDGFNQKIRLNWQVTENFYRRMTITGLQHANFIYKDMKAVTTAADALTPDPVLDENGDPVLGPDGQPLMSDRESPFIVPLHETIYRSMPMVDQTQMATACCFLVFNCYAIDKEEWYETWWFKVIVIAAIVITAVAVAIWTGGASLGVGGAAIIGMLTGAGVSLTAAIVIAAIVVTLGGMLVSYLISKATTVIFGEKWGPLIGAIISTILTLGLSAGGLADALAQLNTPQFWISIGFAAANGVTSALHVHAQEIREDTAKLMEAYNEKNAEIQRLYNEQFGRSQIDPSIVNRYIDETREKPDQFLQRTLMTGSDIVRITLDSISNFTENRLRLDLP